MEENGMLTPSELGGSSAAAAGLSREDIELRTLARLAWNNWEDNELSRGALVEQERKAIAANDAWDRVVSVIRARLQPEPCEGEVGALIAKLKDVARKGGKNDVGCLVLSLGDVKTILGALKPIVDLPAAAIEAPISAEDVR